MFTDAFNHHPGPVAAVRRQHAVGPSDDGRVGAVRAGQRVAEPAGLRGAELGRGHQRRRVATGPAAFCRRLTRACVFRSSGDPVLYLSNPPGVTREMQRAEPRRAQGSERGALRSRPGDVEIASRIASYELAFRMQTAAPELLDFSKESPETLEMYGVNEEPTQAVRHQLPAGPPHGGARRALRDADARELGRSHRAQPQAEEELRHHRPARPRR